MYNQVSGIGNRAEAFGGELVSDSYGSKLIDFVAKRYFYNREIWKLFVNQFRNRTDKDRRWRGEYWGKSMRGAAAMYRCQPDEQLYDVLEESVLDLLSVQAEDGTFSSYPQEKEFSDWDMWGRKYILLGSLYFYDICKSEELKARILEAMKLHADAIIKVVGEGEGKRSIFDTAELSGSVGGMNSCSILEGIVRLYRYTGEERYLAFAKYLAGSGLCYSVDLVKTALANEQYPYQFVYNKAYEMISCFQGLMELYTVTGEPSYLQAAVNFGDMVYESEITVIGCAGCTGELFDHSVERQTLYSEEEMQETCVTVTWMNYCFRLLQLTGDAKYAAWLERSALNAMNGSVNTEMQLGLRLENMDPRSPLEVYRGKKQAVPFDSYSPLVRGRRGKVMGGFNVMEDEQIYGCCACIGGLGLALGKQFGIMKADDGVAVNLYENASLNGEVNGVAVKLELKADLLKSGTAVLRLSSSGRIRVKLRIPDWSQSFAVKRNGGDACGEVRDGYYVLDGVWSDDEFAIETDADVRMIELNGKKAFMKGPYVLARDEKFGEDIVSAVRVDGKPVAVPFENTAFESGAAFKVKTLDGEISLCDYAHAGKRYDEEHTDVSVWLD